MRIGLSTPVVMQLPGVSSAWEERAGADELARIARTADEYGFDHLTCPEHVAVPVEQADRRGVTYWDPLSTLSFFAAHTRRLRLVTAVLVLGYHHPLEIAKRYGTLDRISGGRLVLGVGVGSLAAEFDLLGADYGRRGERADEAIAALRASMSSPRPRFDGEFYRFDGFTVQPCAQQARVPIWVGGRTLRSLRRAAHLGDGWMPFGLRTAQIPDMLARVDTPTSFDVVLPTGRAVDPLGDRVGTHERLTALRSAGATAVTCTVSAQSAEHYCDQLGALSEVAAEITEEAM
ncbi:LLM class F420-dependent oxidoreductase [Mycolicibacterium poriferae]|uniref:LLM class F420-dependent oxidoreductase n=1 Tax=Mycolicibacterium poriferae TaxID=39694 RepID=UPI0024BA6996|nr:LLM class F420-dependent oxidoreductase [Mycolicibacterium poriferae]